MSAKDDVAGVITHPPFLYAGGLLAGWGVDQIAPLPFVPAWAVEILGPALIVTAIALAGWCFVLFTRAGTNVPTHKPTSAIVTHGPYRFSRNPIYVALTMLTLGIALLLDSLWCVASLVPVLTLMQWGVILREERYLERKFGEEYLAFKRQTRRWL
jgi:protein-S-isoprenylcysteine O-methyltransferase Ste14